MTDAAATQWLDRLAGALVMVDDQDGAALAAWADDLMRFAAACDLPVANLAACRELAGSLRGARPQAAEGAVPLVETLQAYLRDHPVTLAPPPATPSATLPPAAAPAAPTPAASGPRAGPGLYLTFLLAREEYGMEILKVQEIIKLMQITRVPRLPAFFRGVINLRGRVLPVTDLRLKFDLPAVEDTERTCIIVAQVATGGRDCTMGLVVDEVSEVLQIDAAQIDPPPEFGTAVDTAYILGVARIDPAVVVLLDIERILTGDELSIISGL